MAETILIVDDEESVRRTLYEWLRDADTGCELLQAWDAESALQIASQRPIDLAILDWNLGAGHNGLQLLEDLRVFWPQVVAILITGYAHQATPLDALRMGVRDYLDKSRDLRRDTLLAIVRRQLETIRPAKRERDHLARVQAFRQAVESLLPLVQTTAELTAPFPVSESLRAFLRLAQTVFQTDQGVLVIRRLPSSSDALRAHADPLRGAGMVHDIPSAEADEAGCTILDLQGQPVTARIRHFADSLVAAALAMRDACVLDDLSNAEHRFGVRLQDYERGHRNLLALPVILENDYAAVLELFDTPLAQAQAAEGHRPLLLSFQNLAAAVLSQIFAERQLHSALLRALQTALEISRQQNVPWTSHQRSSTISDWQQLLAQPDILPREPEELLQLAKQLHLLHHKYGPPALRFCQQLLEQLEAFLSQLLEPPASAP
ncbi:MAG: response regulator [Gemmatales bacterium]|nr:response regulator [Gemmatales bacterium]MDW8176070.1 response regulator [Gemmatales bacterium]